MEKIYVEEVSASDNVIEIEEVSISEDTTTVVKYEYREHLHGDVLIAKLGDRYGILDPSNKSYSNILYDYVIVNPNNTSLASLNNKKGLLNQIGEIILPLEYDEIKFFSGHLTGIKLNGKWAIYSLQYGFISSFRFDDIYTFTNNRYEDDVIGVKYNHKWGIFNHLGLGVTELKYDRVYDSSKGEIMGLLNGHYVIVDMNE